MPSNEVVLSTKPLDLDEDKEFRRIWREVQDCFQGIRPIEGFDFKRDENLDPAAIHKLLDNSPDNAEKTRKKDRGRSSHTFNSTKKVFNRILECIQTLGGIAADTASYAVGAPANLCYNALSFVITVYQSYAGMLASLADLLGRFVGFFGRLDNYREAPMLDWKLKRVAMKQLHLFVKICRHTLRLRRHRSFKAEAVMKTLFFKDDKTKLLLQEMEELERQESGIIWTSTLVIATQLQAALHDLRTNLKADLTETFGNLITQKSIGEEGESKEIEMKRRKKTLIEVLMWPPEDLIVGTNGKMPNYIWESSWHRYTAREAVEGTGRWLQSCKVFRDWVEGKTSDTPVLGIEGAEGAGKTQLAANIITRLREMHGKSSPIAYYFLESDSKAGAASKTGVRAAVTRSLIWQLAESYSPFLKSASDICAKHRAIYDPLDMWKYTLVDNTERVRWSTTFFIILDGLVGDGHAKFLRELLPLLRKSSIGDHRIRVLLTGTSKWFSEIKKEKDLGLKTIKLGKDNIEDVESYINQRMNQMDLLQNLSNINVSEMRQKIIDTLKKVTGGDYRKIDTVLTEISEKDDNLQVETCLEQAETAPADQMITTIQRINLRSSPDEISDMNEMIIWVLYGRSRLTPPQLEVALSLKDGPSTKPAPDGERRTIVRSLGSRIRMERYPLFKLTSADEEIVVSFVGDTNIEDAKEHILDVSERNDDGEFQQFHQTEVRMIEHYLKTVCPGDVYDKFGFREFLSKKLSQTRISLSSGNAEITLALRCLQCLVERSTENIVLLHPYAADHLYSHLHRAEYTGDSQNGPKRNGHLSLTDKELRMRVGVLLIKLLSTQDAMNSLFGIRQPFGGESQSVLAQRSLPSSWKSWMQDDKGLELLKIYFRDPAILESIKNDKSDFEKSITCGDSVMTLLKVAIQMASNLLRQADSMPREIENAFAFLLAAYRKMSSKTLLNPEDRFWNPTVRRVTDVESWSLSYLKRKKPTSSWKAHMAMIYLRLYLNESKHITKEVVEKSAREAFNIDNENWKAAYTLAQVTKSRDEATKILERMTELLSTEKAWIGDITKRRVLAEMYLELGDKLWFSNDSQMQKRAIAAYSESTKMDTSYVQRYLGVISRFTDKMLWKDIASFLDMLLEDPSQASGAPIGNLVVAEDNSRSFDDIIIRTAQEQDRWDLLRKVYEEGIKAAAHNYRTKFLVRFRYGKALRKSLALQDEGLRVWETALELEPEEPERCDISGSYALKFLVPELMPIYMERALAEAKTPASMSSSVSELTFSAKISRLHGRFQSLDLFKPRDLRNGLHFSRYYIRIEKDELAKALIRDLLKQSLKMMFNDDPTDDHACYWQLQMIFTTFEDEANALAAWNMMAISKKDSYDEYFRKLDRWRRKVACWEATKLSKVGEKSEGGNLLVPCSTEEDPLTDIEGSEDESSKPIEPTVGFGVRCYGCNYKWKYPSAIYTCADDCGRVQFDKSCYDKLQKGTLGKDICDKNHKFLKVPKQDMRKGLKMKEGFVRVGTEVITLEAWRQKIEERYLDHDGKK